ncbi:hypothetical protein BsWGS_02303 [Bradybaena similaris]
MRTCVTSSYDVAGSGQSFLDAADRVIDSGQMDSHFDTLECYSFLWDMFKDDDTSPSSTTSGRSSEGGGDEEVISSSSSRTIICNKISPSQSPSTAKEKAVVDSPPDDVRAFFGHPLTRATNALNGDEVDTNADAEALLHEYKNLPSIERDDNKVSARLNSFLDIVSGQQSDPSLSTTRSEIRSSLSSEAPVSPDAGQLHHGGDVQYEEEEEEDCEQKANDLAMTAYVSIFLQDELQLDECILNGSSIEQSDVNTEEAQLLTTKQHAPKRSRVSRRGQSLQKRGQAGEVKRAKRKSRARSDAVTSTTNGQQRQIKDGPVLDEHGSSAFNESLEVGVHPLPGSQFHHEEAGVSTSTIVSSLLSGVGLPSTPTVDSNCTQSAEGQNRISSICAGLVPLSVTSSTASIQQPSDHRDLSSQLQNPIKVLSPVAAIASASNSSHAMPCSSASQPTAVTPSLSTSPRVTVANTTPVSVEVNALSTSVNSHHVSLETAVKENGYLKRVLSEKIRSRQSIEDNLLSIPSQALKFISENDADIRMEPTFIPAVSIKQEDSYADCYAHQYTYGSELANNIPSLTNCSALAMASANGFPNILPETMEMCEEAITPHDCNNNTSGLAGMAASSLHHIPNNTADHVSFHQHRQHHHQSHHQQQQQHCHGNKANDHVTGDSMKIQPSQEQYFQALQPMQPIESHTHMPRTNCNSANMNNAAACFYNHHGFHNSPNSQLMDPNKQMAVERYLHQQYAYSSGYTHFLNPDRSYNMKSPDSGFHEPCLSPTSTPLETATSGIVDVKTEKTKKKKSTNGAGALMRQYSSSSSEKMTTRSTVVQKLEVNSTGYSYFLETPISTTQRRHEDRVTYLNKSQYYGLSLECNIQERIIKCAIVKSVIILAFREEKPMEDERRAWEFWHGRQHSYKQRILDIDTKNCQGVLPQNIEELAFNAVAVKWNPMEGPVRVNIAVHCLSTDFSNQKGVKGIPLHIQIDTYEQSLQETQLVHRGYCQIKAFCDKGAERKTRDEERRKAAKGKPEEFNSISVTTKSRRRLEEAFHEPCERSEFYSMANTTTPPVFFNPLHENSEFIHKSLTLGVVPSQEEEVTSVPSKLELPDSCDDYYINSPVKRPRTDSVSNLKDQQKVLLYIRESHETAYTALMLEIPTLHGLLRSIELKYSIAPSKVKHVYKKSRKGILVKLDDNIVRHYSHEATFVIETNILNDNGDYEIILVEIDPVSS